jgi:5-oxoprolinase (ATP-hydrolysing)
MRFLDAMTATTLSSHRDTDPYGLAGGGPGARGHNYVERADGTVDELKGNDETEMRPGDVFVLETPGGGGFGAPVEDRVDPAEIPGELAE